MYIYIHVYTCTCIATVTTVTLTFLPSFLNTNRSAKEIAEVRGKRAKTSYKGIPNTKTGACCAAKEFREAIKEHENEKQGKTKAAVEKKKLQLEKRDDDGVSWRRVWKCGDCRKNGYRMLSCDHCL
jgi:hypothetical protein